MKLYGYTTADLKARGLTSDTVEICFAGVGSLYDIGNVNASNLFINYTGALPVVHGIVLKN